MSLIEAIENPQLRREAFLRHCSASLRVGSPEHDWSQNGWPKEVVEKMLVDGAKHGRGAPGWSVAQGPSGEQYLSAELESSSGFTQILMDPSSGKCVFKSSSGAFSCDSFASAAEMVAHNSHQDGARARSMNPTSAYATVWQGEAPAALASMAPGIAAFHPRKGADASEAWERDFDAIDKHCESQRDPHASFEAVRAQYLGSASGDLAKRIASDLAAAPTQMIGGQPGRVISIGARGNEIRAAIPLKASGAIDPNMPIMATIGSVGPAGFAPANPADQPMRFYSMEAFASFASSAQSVDVGNAPGVDVAARLAARRPAQSQPSISVAAAPGM